MRAQPLLESKQRQNVSYEGYSESFYGALDVTVNLCGAITLVDRQADKGDRNDKEADGEKGNELETPRIISIDYWRISKDYEEM